MQFAMIVFYEISLAVCHEPVQAHSGIAAGTP
jgi:hypothetical protein